MRDKVVVVVVVVVVGIVVVAAAAAAAACGDGMTEVPMATCPLRTYLLSVLPVSVDVEVGGRGV